MRKLSVIYLYSQDPALVRRVTGYFDGLLTVRTADSPGAVERHLDRHVGMLLLVDLRAPEAVALVESALEPDRRTVVVALGVPGSEPARQAAALGVYAVEATDAERPRMQTLVWRALDHLYLLGENERLRRDIERTAGAVSVRSAEAEHGATRGPRHYPGALCPVTDVEYLLQNLAEDVASTLLVSRVGMFCRARDSETFKLRGGLRCLEDTAALEYTARDPLVRWLGLNAHLVSRANLEHIRDASARALLTETLDTLGAEILVPLQARGRLLGWLFVGHRMTGLPFESARLEDLVLLAEHVSTALENALLYEEVAVQKTLAETLLQTMPVGIVAVDADGVIRSFNAAARQIFNRTAEEVLNQRAECLHSRVADQLRRALTGKPADQLEEWTEPATHRILAARSRRLEGSSGCLGAVALVQDLTVERMLQQKQAQVERAAFWAELAAGMSHEIRNPLVAIKTFAQLLPERYTDEEFRNQFSGIVSQEVDRLNRIIDQINEFAYPRQMDRRLLAVREVVNKGLEAARARLDNQSLPVDVQIEPELPPVLGDAQALAACVSHLVTNSMEALAGKKDPQIVVEAHTHRDGNAQPFVEISVRDNGRGIPPSEREKVFSPFYTTKVRGMGLGLPIVQRTVIDHNGRVHIDTSQKGTCVTLVLPAGPEGDGHETHPDRG